LAQRKGNSMKNRIELAKYFAEKGFTIGAEIGVYKGEYAEILFKNIPDLKLICIDSWAQGRRIPAKAEAISRLSPYKDRLVIGHCTSLEGVKYADDNSLDFVFIDAGHSYEDVKADINAWTPKVRSGGIVSGHDYYEFPSGRGGVIPAVNEYVAEHGYALHIIPWDKSQSTDNRQPCWWFEKT
jgi:predicted O-methyltransferase YrrM